MVLDYFSTGALLGSGSVLSTYPVGRSEEIEFLMDDTVIAMSGGDTKM